MHDHARELYSLDGNDLRQLGPDDACEIKYADGTQYYGACLACAVPDAPAAVMIEPNGTKYEGPFSHGLRTGMGNLTLTNGIVYEGYCSYPGGARHGEGKLTIPENLQAEVGYCTYAGQYANGLRSGTGELVFNGGSIYKGNFRENRRNGSGIFSKGSNLKYHGPWEGDVPGLGEAETNYSSGHTYAGGMRGAKRHGQGILKDGRGALVYKGQWQDDLMHGEGELSATDGVYKGSFVKGIRSGQGRFQYNKPIPGSNLPVPPSSTEIGAKSQQRYYQGSWANDLPEGKGNYMDEYGYENKDATFYQGKLTSEHRPPVVGVSNKLFNNPRWPKKFEPETPAASPQSSFPKAEALLDVCGSLPVVDPPILSAIDIDSGFATARTRPAHKGLDGVAGSRWA
jgi:hypothetical protein